MGGGNPPFVPPEPFGRFRLSGAARWVRSAADVFREVATLSPIAATRYVGNMSESDKPLRQQIDDAMEAIRHQVERLREGPSMGGPSDDLTLIADLKAEYQALKEARTGLGPHDRAPEESDGETPD